MPGRNFHKLSNQYVNAAITDSFICSRMLVCHANADVCPGHSLCCVIPVAVSELFSRYWLFLIESYLRIWGAIFAPEYYREISIAKPKSTYSLFFWVRYCSNLAARCRLHCCCCTSAGSNQSLFNRCRLVPASHRRCGHPRLVILGSFIRWKLFECGCLEDASRGINQRPITLSTLPFSVAGTR